MIIKIFQERDSFVHNRQDNDLLVKMPSPNAETSQRQNLNDNELVQCAYLENLGTTDNIEKTYIQDRLGNKDIGQMSQLYRETKTDKMQKLRREIKFLERGIKGKNEN